MSDSGLRIRVDDELRSDFIEACRSNDMTAAQVLRAFMRNYIKNNNEKKQELLVSETESI
jgi:antitoxin component of RelBE/YafQ-DinJ toxin-antitoxin module